MIIVYVFENNFEKIQIIQTEKKQLRKIQMIRKKLFIVCYEKAT